MRVARCRPVLHRFPLMPAALRTRREWQLDTPNRRLAAALAASLVLHLILYGTWRLTPIVVSSFRSVVHKIAPQLSQATTPPRQAAQQQRPKPPAEIPMVFVEVDPALATVEPPKETPNYSTLNSIAANQETRKAIVPKIDGTQKKVLRTQTNPRPSPQPLQPTPPKPETPAPPKEEVHVESKPPPTPQPPEPKPIEEPAEIKPKPPEVGDLAMARTERPTVAPPTQGSGEEKPRQRPRTLREVVQQNPSLAGQKSLQEGGVPRRGHIALDAKRSDFGDYDYAFIRAVEQRWYQLLDNYMLDRQGSVVLTFRLHFDGRITDMEVDSNNVGDILGLLCQKAIIDPSPFPKWPIEMRRKVPGDYREVKFTFYYD